MIRKSSIGPFGLALGLVTLAASFWLPQRLMAQDVTVVVAQGPAQSPLSEIDTNSLSAASADAAPSTLAFAKATASLRRAMDIPYSGDADVDFIRAMQAHQQGVIALARVEMAYGAAPEIRKIAEDIITSEQAKLDVMQNWLSAHTPAE